MASPAQPVDPEFTPAEAIVYLANRVRRAYDDFPLGRRVPWTGRDCEAIRELLREVDAHQAALSA